MSSVKRVCVIGAGPSGMSVLYHFDKLRQQGKEIPEIVCFEKQSDWGGLWKYTWRTGIGEHGEPVHGSMYRNLWSNGPKEASEFPDYTFDDHFGKPIPSFPPREVLLDYLKGRWSQRDLRSWIRFEQVVQNVTFDASSDDFTLVVKNLAEDRVLPVERFDYVIVASGHFSVPHVPSFPGIERFPGQILHSHDFRNACQFKGMTVLVVGASYSAEDIALQCLKYGAKNIICTWRTKPMGFKWPSQITERPLLTKIEEKTIHFRDGSKADVDAILLCTGYLFCFPFLEDNLRLKSTNVLYPRGLYKNTLWMTGGNNKLLYIGMQSQCYTYTLFDVQAKWAVNYIMGDIPLPDKESMESDCKKWISRMETLKGCHDDVDFQTDFIVDISKESSYGYDLNVADMTHLWLKHKEEDIITYRDRSFTSKFSGTTSPVYHTTFMEAFDDSMKSYLSTKNE